MIKLCHISQHANCTTVSCLAQPYFVSGAVLGLLLFMSIGKLAFRNKYTLEGGFIFQFG